MTQIRQEDFTQSVHNALQYISCYHPLDFIRAMYRAWQREQSPAAHVIAFPELGMEAVYEFEVEDMPVTVAVDSKGESIHRSGPELWKKRIAEIPVASR